VRLLISPPIQQGRQALGLVLAFKVAPKYAICTLTCRKLHSWWGGQELGRSGRNLPSFSPARQLSPLPVLSRRGAHPFGPRRRQLIPSARPTAERAACLYNPCHEALRGVFTPIVTPFLRDGAVDENGLRSNVTRWMTTPLEGLVVLGSNGEAPQLDDVEAGLKSALALAGFAAGPPRPPLLPVSSYTVELLRSLLEALGTLAAEPAPEVRG